MAPGMTRLAVFLASLLIVGWVNAVNIEDPCDNTNKCEIVGAECKASKCLCLDSYTPSANKTKCEQELLGGICIETAQCLVALTECQEAEGSKTCVCKTAADPSTDNKECLPVATSTDGACTMDQQCIIPFLNSACVDEKCKCSDTHVENSLHTACLKKVDDFESVCEQSQQCSILNSECSGETGAMKCICSSGYFQNSVKDACVMSADIIGESCSEDPKQCESITNSHCVDKICTCIDDFTGSLDKKRCLEIRETLNEDCEEAQQCSTKIENSVCTGGKCTCSNTHVAGSELKSCLEKRNYNESCFEPQQCFDLTLGNTDCFEQRCECKSENHFEEERCWENINLGQICEAEEECILSDGNTENIECVVGKCTCIVDYKPDEEKNICNSGVTNTVAFISMVIFFAAIRLC